jgi:hypothetical protein
MVFAQCAAGCGERCQIALWYYFRWQIESFFKPLKQAGPVGALGAG